jgi:hypothetical protein
MQPPGQFAIRAGGSDTINPMGGFMTKELTESKSLKFARRHFLRGAAMATAVTCLSEGPLLGCRAKPGSTVSVTTNADVMEQALEMMAHLAPLTNHGPMAAEALVALGRADAVVAFVEAYKKRFRASYPEPRRAVTRENWRQALGDGTRVADWKRFFNREIKEAAWPLVLERWMAILAPGLAAAAAHGLIRTSHAVRSLSVKDTDLRRRELAEGLSYWAAYYQPLPETQTAKADRLRPAQAISQVPLLPEENRPASGSIMIGLRSLDDFPPFAGVADFIEATGKQNQFLLELTETFAVAYMKNVTSRNFITLIHAVTGTSALRWLLPHLSPATAGRLLRYGWQMAAGLYSISGTGSANNLPEAVEIKRNELIDRATASQEEHAIKFTEVCLREYALNPKPVYLQAARDAINRL